MQMSNTIDTQVESHGLFSSRWVTVHLIYMEQISHHGKVSV